MPPTSVHRDRATWLNIATACVFLVAWVPVAQRAARGVADGHVPMSMAAALLGVAVADLVSGLLHWMFDRWFSERTPLIGRSVVRPFREHHVDPLAMIRRPFLLGSSSNFVGATSVLLLAQAAAALAVLPPSAFTDVWLASLTVALAVTNQIHKWAHMVRVPRPVGWLQASHLILTPQGHALHHARGEGAYCITTGWLNPIVDRLEVFGILERIMGRAVPTGAHDGG